MSAKTRVPKGKKCKEMITRHESPETDKRCRDETRVSMESVTEVMSDDSQGTLKEATEIIIGIRKQLDKVPSIKNSFKEVLCEGLNVY